MATQHPVSALFPPMSEQEYEGLKADIKENGQHHPIVVLKEGDSQGGLLVLDGWNRLRACKELDKEAVIKEWAGECGTPERFIVAMNLHRRHLDASQRGFIAAQLRKGIGNFTLSEALETTRETPERNSENPVLSVPEAAAALQVSPKTVSDATLVLERGTEEEKEQVKQGKLKVNRVARGIRSGKSATERKAERQTKKPRTPRKPKAEPELTKPQHTAEPDHPAPEPAAVAPRSWTDPQQYVPQQVKHVVDEILGLPEDPEMVMVMVRETPEIGEVVEEKVYKALDWLDRYCAALTKARHEALTAKVRRTSVSMI